MVKFQASETGATLIFWWNLSHVFMWIYRDSFSLECQRYYYKNKQKKSEI